MPDALTVRPGHPVTYHNEPHIPAVRELQHELAKPTLLHIGGTWSPSHHSAISPSAVRSALRKPVVGGGGDA